MLDQPSPGAGGSENGGACIRLVITLAAIAAVLTASNPAEARVRRCERSGVSYNLCAIHHWRDATHRYQRLLAAHLTRYGWTADRPTASAAYRRQMRHLWYTRAVAWRHRLMPWQPDWLSAAVCVHQHEGSWSDPAAPYYGGLQMDVNFMAAYGPRLLHRYGTADHWAPVSQLHVAYRGWVARGWEPWPNTAAACGLL